MTVQIDRRMWYDASMNAREERQDTRAIDMLVDRLKHAGVYGKTLERHVRMARICGPYFVWKAVINHENDALARR